MDGEKNSRPDRQFRRRWVDYLRNLETVITLQQALEQAVKETDRQLEEMRKLLVASGPIPELHEKGTKESRPTKPAGRSLP